MNPGDAPIDIIVTVNRSGVHHDFRGEAFPFDEHFYCRTHRTTWSYLGQVPSNFLGASNVPHRDVTFALEQNAPLGGVLVSVRLVRTLLEDILRRTAPELSDSQVDDVVRQARDASRPLV